MSCIEIINSKDITDVDTLAEELQKETFDVNLPNGAQLIQHSESAYSNVYTNGKSFDDLSTKEAVSEIGFAFNFKVHPDGVKKMKAVGNTIQSNTLVVQHKCVMYSYAYALTVAAAEPELVCEFRLFPISHTYRHPTGAVKGGVASTMKQKAPELENVKLKIGNISEKVELVAEMDGSYKCTTLITLESLINITKEGVANLRIEFSIDSAYFDIDEYVHLHPKQAPIASNSNAILEKMLSGEKVPKSDWVVSAGDGGFPRDYHCHGIVLANSSFILRAAIEKHMSIGGDVLTMVSHENRFILPKLKSSDMRVLLTYIYQKRFALPNYDAVSRVGAVLAHLFRDEIGEFFENWQAQLVKKTMQLNRFGGAETIVECIKTLIFVHSAPQGALLAAYNCALIVAADAWQICEKSRKNDKQKMVKKIKKLIEHDWPIIDQIIEIIQDFQETVCGVEKQQQLVE